MELLFSVISLMVRTLEGIISAVLASAATEKRRVGKELASIIVRLDRILARAEFIVSFIDKQFSKGIPSIDDLSVFEAELEQQSKEVEKLGFDTVRIGETSKSRSWLNSTARVIHVFGDLPYDLPTIMDFKGLMIDQLLTLVRNMYVLSEDKKGLVVRQYEIVSKPNVGPNDYINLMTDKSGLEKNLQTGWLRYDEIDLQDPKQRRNYTRELSKQLDEIKATRKAIASMLKKHFEIVDVM